MLLWTFYGRFRSELSFEAKVFVHAELTPMAKPKKPIVTPTKVGLVKAQIKTAVDSHTGKTRTRYRTYCTKAIVPKDQQRREWPSMDGSIKWFPSNHRQTSRPNLLFVGVECKARTSSGGGGGFIGLFPDLKCPLGSGGGGLKILVCSVSDGEGVKEFGVFILSDHAKAPSQCKSFDRASERCIRRGGQEQGKLIGSIKLFGVVTEGILIVGNGFGDHPLVAKGVGVSVMGLSQGTLELNVGSVNLEGGIQMGECFFIAGQIKQDGAEFYENSKILWIHYPCFLKCLKCSFGFLAFLQNDPNDKMDIGQFLRTGSGNCFRDYDMSLEIVQTLGNLVVIDELAVDSEWVDIWRRPNPLPGKRHGMVTPEVRIGIKQIDIGKELIDADRALVDNSHASIAIKEKTARDRHGQPSVEKGALEEIKVANGLGGRVVGVKREFQFCQCPLGSNSIFRISVKHVYAQTL